MKELPALMGLASREIFPDFKEDQNGRQQAELS